MFNNFSTSKVILVFYRILFPILVVILLLLLASINIENRVKILGSTLSDLTIRLLISVWFCALYIRLSKLSQYRIYPNKRWSREDIGTLERHTLSILIIFFGVLCGIATFWTIRWFLPSLSNFALLIAGLNSILILIPMIMQYWIFKI